MTYTDQAALYRGGDRNRYDMCIREQAHAAYLDDADPANAALAKEVVNGDPGAIDSVIAAICVGPDWENLGEDVLLKQAVDEAWPRVAQARYTG